MALSKSFPTEQVPMVCQMCEESNDIKWKCLQCDFLLCTKCQKLHKKVKSTDQHTIIDIKDIASHQLLAKDNINFSNIQCGIHSDYNCFLFCQSCKVVVCPLCITKLHNKHNMIELIEGYELTLKSLKEFNSEIEEEVYQNEKVLSELGILKASEESKYELEKQNILSREKNLKDEVEKHTNKILKEFDQRKEILVNSVNSAKNRSEKFKHDLDSRKMNLIKAIHSNNANHVFSVHLEEKTAKHQGIVPISPMFQKLPKFVPGKNVIQDFYLGELTETDDRKQFEFKVIKQCKTDLPLVENVVCCNDAGIWICGFPSFKLYKMKLTNDSLCKLCSFETNIHNMALLPSGDLLLSLKESNLKIISCDTSQIEPTNYSVHPFITLAVHVTSDHKILVGTRENQPKPFSIKGPRQVIVMNMDGKKEKVYHTNEKGKPILTIPRRITTDNDNNIYVVDTLDEERKGRIVALDKTSGVRWIYSENPDTNSGQTLKPRDLAATKSDNIILTDTSNDMIHILNTSGQCIYYINTKDQLGIESPFSVDIDNAGTLYLGCSTYENEPDHAKIYTVQVSEI